MAIEKFCDHCKQKYDWEKNSTLCPHQGFPKIKQCEKHQRTNCGNHECQTNLRTIPQRKEQRA